MLEIAEQNNGDKEIHRIRALEICTGLCLKLWCNTKLSTPRDTLQGGYNYWGTINSTTTGLAQSWTSFQDIQNIKMVPK